MFKKITTSKTLPAVFMLSNILGAICFRAARQNWVFFAVTAGFDLPFILFMGMILMGSLFGILFALSLRKKEITETKNYRITLIVAGVFALILSVFALIHTVLYALDENTEVFFLSLGKTLREGAFMLIVPFFVLFYPKFPCKLRKAVAGISVLAVLLCGINAYYPLAPYKITSEPMVIDNGSEYSIVFSTNDEGSAYVEYTYKGKDYKVSDNNCGRLVTDKIHNIAVPYEHLRNNSYKVSSTRVIEDFSYGSRRGKTVTSKEYELKYNDSADQTWLVISDWHTKLQDAYDAIDNLDTEFDAVMLVGDSSPGVDFQQQIITNTVIFGGQVSGGTKPVLYVRGNHETRGPFAAELPDYLGIEQLYYTAEIGPYSFVVLDSGEDKEDSHIEYGGMTDYNTYRADMIEWLKGVEVENEKVIAISHAWQISCVEAELSQEGWAQLDRLGARLMISGHEHACRILGEKEGYEKEIKEKYLDIIGYLDGGKINGGFTASLLTLNESGFGLRAVDNLGNTVLNESFDW